MLFNKQFCACIKFKVLKMLGVLEKLTIIFIIFRASVCEGGEYENGSFAGNKYEDGSFGRVKYVNGSFGGDWKTEELGSLSNYLFY